MEKSILDRIIAWIRPLRWLIIIMWIVINIFGLLFGLKFFDETTTTFVAPTDSDAYVATETMNEFFPSQAGIHWASIYIKSYNMSVFEEPLSGLLTDFNKELLSKTTNNHGLYSMSSYYLLTGLNLTIYAAQYVSAKTDKATFITVGYETDEEKEGIEFCTQLLSDINDLKSKYHLDDYCSIEETGLEFFELDSLEGVKKDSAVMDQYIGPAAFVVLAVVIQNAPVMIIPLITIVSALLLQFLLMYFIAQLIDVIAFVPSLMVSLTFACAIDYSLFMLSRFCEEQRNNKTIEESILLMMNSAGMTILMSGCTLMVCFIGLLFFSMEMLQSIGVGAACTLFAILATHLTLLPALLYVFGHYIMIIHSYVNVEKMPIFGSKSTSGQGLTNKLMSCCGSFVARYRTGSAISSSVQSDNTNSSYIENFDHGGTIFDGSPTITGKGYTSVDKANISAPRTSGSNNTNKGFRSRSDEDEEILLALGASILSEPGDPLAHDDLHQPLYQRVRNSDELLDKLDGGEGYDEDGESMAAVKKNIWYRLGAFLLVKWQGVVLCLVLIVLMIPVDIYCLKLKQDIDFVLMIPSDSSSYQAYAGMSNNFGPGFTVPYRILFESTIPHDSLYSDSGYKRIRQATEYMISELPYTSLNDFFGAYMVDGEYVSYDDIDASVHKRPNETDSTDSAYKLLRAEFYSPLKNTSAYSYFYLEVNPYTQDGVNWLKQARDLTGHIKHHYSLNVYYVDGASVTYDAVEAVYAEFPVIIIVTLVTVFVLMAVSFKSISAPLRLVVTIILTLAFCYGLTVLTYQYGVFEWFNSDAFANYHSVNWLPPVMCFTIIVGLALDYDVFLISRVLEFRENGYTSDGSIIKGVYKTGYIITDAGIIMAIAFSGLFLSTTVVLNEVAFLLVVAVLLDTFVIRTVIVPILMGLSGKSAWWPRTFPLDKGENNYGFTDTETPKLMKRIRKQCGIYQ